MLVGLKYNKVFQGNLESYETDNYSEILEYIHKLGKEVNYSNDYTISVFIEKNEFDKVPGYENMNALYHLDDIDEWVRIYDTFGVLILEDLQGFESSNRRIFIDPLINMKGFNHNDIVYCECTNKFHVIRSLNNNLVLCSPFDDWLEIYETPMPPSRYLHKVDKYTINSLQLEFLISIADYLEIH